MAQKDLPTYIGKRKTQNFFWSVGNLDNETDQEKKKSNVVYRSLDLRYDSDERFKNIIPGSTTSWIFSKSYHLSRCQICSNVIS